MFKVFGNSAINMSHVRKVRRVGSDAVEITYSNGETETVSDVANLDLFELYTTVIPAPPGYAVVNYAGADVIDAESTTWNDPIVAFAVSDTGPIPITLQGLMSDSEENGVLLPDGKVDRIHEQTFDSIEHFKKAMDERHAARNR